jgi:hypothetical protein
VPVGPCQHATCRASPRVTATRALGYPDDMTLVCILTLLACTPTEDPPDPHDASAGNADSAAPDSGHSDSGDSGADTSTSDPDCGEDGLCELLVTDVSLGGADPTDPHTLTATASGAHTVAVVDHHFADGCCPDASVAAVASLRNNRIDVSYALTDDPCDCFTGLTLTYTLSGVPSGTFELAAGGVSTTVTVD